jgi:hypothetical protein
MSLHRVREPMMSTVWRMDSSALRSALCTLCSALSASYFTLPYG